MSNSLEDAPVVPKTQTGSRKSTRVARPESVEELVNEDVWLANVFIEEKSDELERRNKRLFWKVPLPTGAWELREKKMGDKWGGWE